jgi:hypothetical protein
MTTRATSRLKSKIKIIKIKINLNIEKSYVRGNAGQLVAHHHGGALCKIDLHTGNEVIENEQTPYLNNTTLVLYY